MRRVPSEQLQRPPRTLHDRASRGSTHPHTRRTTYRNTRMQSNRGFPRARQAFANDELPHPRMQSNQGRYRADGGTIKTSWNERPELKWLLTMPQADLTRSLGKT